VIKNAHLVAADVLQQHGTDWASQIECDRPSEPTSRGSLVFSLHAYHPLKAHFQLTYLADAATRVCLYISKRINPSTWSVSYISKDIISLQILNPHSERKISVFNVYNEMGTDTLSTLAEEIRALDSPEKTIVLGDFNLHHPLWSATHRRASNGSSVQGLLTIIEEFQLQLLTEPGTSTHRWKDGESTIDLTFASEELAGRVVHCKIDREVNCDSDHLPIALAVDWSWQPTNPTRKRLWAKTNLAELRKTVKAHLPQSGDTTELRDKDDIDKFVSSIISALDAGIAASTPWSNPSPRSIAGFDQECKDICTEVQQLRRRWQRSWSIHSYKMLSSDPFWYWRPRWCLKWMCRHAREQWSSFLSSRN
jgi:hypothetical protein